MIDTTVLLFIAVLTVFGLIRGIISQLMSLIGLVTAYLFAVPCGRLATPAVQDLLGSTRFMAEKVSILLIGLSIYLVARLIGFLIEKLLINRVQEFKKLNRVGGALAGCAKGVAFVAVVFFFLALIPSSQLHAWMPNVLKSNTYKLAARYNPLGPAVVLDRMRILRHTLNDPAAKQKMVNDPRMEKLLDKYELRSALRDARFIRSIEEGDYDTLRKNEQVEALMKDDHLAEVLGELSKDPRG